MHLAVLLALAATLPLAPARLITTSQEAFTQSAAEVLKVELGKRVHAPVTVAVKGPLELKVDLADKGQVLVGLLKPWRVCESAADQEHCQTNGVAFIGKLADELLASLKGPPPVSAPQLRLYVRNRSYIEQIKKLDPNVVVEPLAGELWTVLVLDLPKTSKVVKASELASLKLDAAAAKKTALANVIHELGHAKDKLKELSPGMGMLWPPAYYNLGLVTSVEEWAPLAKAVKGRLLVSVPNDEAVLYCHCADAEKVAGFRAATQGIFRDAERRVSEQILEWTETGWKPFAETPSR